MKNFYLLLLIPLFTCTFCTNQNRLEQALQRADSNRPELEKVLAYYSRSGEDPQKLRAAEFLIENMVYHYTMENENLLAYFQEIAAVNQFSRDSVPSEFYREQYDSINAYYKDRLTPLKYKWDIENISAEYLIENIDVACHRWKVGNFSRHLSFEQFCEYLLPYRIGCEPAEDWRREMEERCMVIVEWITTRDNWQHNTFEAATHISNHVRDKGFNVEDIGLYALDYPPSVLTNIKLGSCNEYVMFTAYIARAIGVPVAIDYVIQWPFRNSSHSWNAVLSNDGIWYRFMGGERTPGQAVNQGMKKGKVYRKTFAYQENSLFHHNQRYKERIPVAFNTPFMMDVSDLYFDGMDVAVKLIRKPSKNTKYVYLAVFDNQKWVPIQWCAKKGDKANFAKMERDIAYLPVYYIDGQVEPAGNPFILTIDKRIETLIPDRSKTHSLSLVRKYPKMSEMMSYSERMAGGYFEASDYSDFSNADTIGVIEKVTHMNFDSVVVSPATRKYRYWRYVAPQWQHCNVAELRFVDENKKINNYKTIIYSESTSEKNKGEAAFDGDGLTFYESKAESYGWVGVDFGIPTCVEKILFLPRNDDNNIRIGDLYELVCWENGGWASLGTQTAVSGQLVFDNVPENALLLLHNHTRGREERIFTVEDGEIMWW